MGYIAPIQPDLYFQYINRPAPQDKEDYAKVTKVTRTFHDKVYRELEKKEDLVTEAETKVQQKSGNALYEICLWKKVRAFISILTSK